MEPVSRLVLWHEICRQRTSGPGPLHAAGSERGSYHCTQGKLYVNRSHDGVARYPTDWDDGMLASSARCVGYKGGVLVKDEGSLELTRREELKRWYRRKITLFRQARADARVNPIPPSTASSTFHCVYAGKGSRPRGLPFGLRYAAPVP